MPAQLPQIREERRRSPDADFGLESALAAIVRRRWPHGTIENVAAEWDLTEGRSRGVVYGQASLTTVNQIIRHRRGGWRIGLELLQHMLGERLEAFLKSETERLCRDAQERLEEARRLEAAERTLSDRALDDLGVGLGRMRRHMAVRPAGSGRCVHAPMGR